MSTVSQHRDNFEAWFDEPLSRLRDPEAGFIVAMVVFPLLERYVGRKTNEAPNRPRFNQELVRLFPELHSEANANLFWAVYRHGLLHNVTLSRDSHGLSHGKPIIEVVSGGKVWMNPNLFADRVLAAIRADFDTFVGGESLPIVYPAQSQSVLGFPSYYVGTGMPSGTDRK